MSVSTSSDYSSSSPIISSSHSSQSKSLSQFARLANAHTLMPSYVGLWKQLTFALTLILNIFNLISFDSSFGDRMNNYLLYDITSNSRISLEGTQRIVSKEVPLASFAAESLLPPPPFL